LRYEKGDGVVEVFQSYSFGGCKSFADGLSGTYSGDVLKPTGERLYTKTKKKFIHQRHYGHKFKGCW